ncbi:hypothetical protein HWV23_03365 [Natronomonas halophila]|uniref:hypothetical protein n=1 Tax=Natronomonas halophila TaxID=2747817 RepID=UPI0015B41E5A|nr:hypothetical protein [Natronomonas halophila]QLD84790.1 hypothetical protein HWV23_03365 [Natronomonas halophila]
MSDEDLGSDPGRNLVRRSLPLIIAVSAIGAFLITAGHTIAIGLPQLSYNGDWGVVSSGLVALATLILAFVTYSTLQHTEEQIRHLQRQVELQETRLINYQKEIERPLVKDVLQQVLLPSLEGIESNLARLDSSSNKGIGWKQSNPQGAQSTELDSLVELDEVDPVLIDWLRDNYPSLIDSIEAYQEKKVDFEDTMDTVAREIEVPIRKEFQTGRFDPLLQEEEDDIPSAVDEVEWLIRKAINQKSWSNPKGGMIHPEKTLVGASGGNIRGLFRRENYGREETAERYQESMKELTAASEELKEEVSEVIQEVQNEYNIPPNEFD